MARWIADDFNQNSPAGCAKVEVVTCCRLTAIDGSAPSVCMEPFLDEIAHGDYTTWSEGPTFCGSDTNDRLVLEAFMHFSQAFTCQKSMVADLKGARRKLDNAYVLTDPVIMSAGGGPNGSGISQFSLQHRCNDYCRAMELPPCERFVPTSDDSRSTSVRSQSSVSTREETPARKYRGPSGYFSRVRKKASF
ncbi:unnamed protein product [Sphacelaria rigidula]